MTSRQTPIHSGFGAHSTATDVLAGVYLHGKNAIITGGASGIGFETTRALAQAGATVIVAVRHPDKARQALASIPRTEVGQIDLMDPASIDAFSARLHKDPARTAIQAPENALRVAGCRTSSRNAETQYSGSFFQLIAAALDPKLSPLRVRWRMAEK